MRTPVLAVFVLGIGAGYPAASLAQAAPRQSANQATPDPGQQPPAEKPSLLDGLRAFDDFADVELDELLNVTVSIAAGRAQTLEEAPSIVAVITNEDIRRTGVRTVAEALRLIAGIDVLEDNFGRGRIAIRGVSSGLTSGSSENVLVLFNGHRLNDEVTGGATTLNLDIPVENVHKIEIIRGPGSAIFGANAFLGTINIVSHTADTFQGVEVSAGGGSFDTAQASLLFGKSVGRLSLSGFGMYGRTDGARLLIPADVQTSTDQALAPLGVQPASEAPGRTVDDRRPLTANFTAAYENFTVNGRVADEDAGGYIGVLDNLGRRNRSRTNQFTLDGSYRRKVGSTGEITATSAFTRNISTLFLDVFPPRFTLASPVGFAVFPDGLLIDATVGSRRVGGQTVYNQRLFRRNTVTTGAAVETESTFGLASRGNFDPLTFAPRSQLGPLPPAVSESRRTSVGLFAQDTWYPIPAIGLTGGLRWDHYNDFGSSLNPRAGMVWKLPRNLNLKVLYGHAFRPPTFTELFFAFPGFTGNPDLRPATIDTFEVALGYKRRDFRLSGNVYVNSLSDLIVIDRPISPLETARYVNRPGINATGVELEARRFFGPGNWLQVGYAYARSKEKESGQRVADVPRNLGNVAGSVSLGKHLSVTPQLFFRGSLARVPIDPRPPLDGYVLLNLNVQAANIGDAMDVVFTLDNLADRDYFDPSPFGGVPGDYPRPGRRALVKVRWRF